MLAYYGKIECLSDTADVREIIINISQNIEHFSVLLDALEYQLIKSINVIDKNDNNSITICIKEAAEFLVDSYELRITIDQAMLLKKMICDVVIGNSFPGYHSDFEIPSKSGKVDLCVIIS